MEDYINSTPYPSRFSDIAPYTDADFKEKLEKLAHEPGFEHAMRYVNPGIDYDKFVDSLLSVKSQNEFQTRIMCQFLEYLEKKTTSGITMTGEENLKAGTSYTFITNHRDIVLDAAFLNLSFIRKKLSCTQIAIGNNLLIYEWISDLVKINRSFIVKRDVKMVEALDAAKQLSDYIHYTINQRHESVWIAQREGRAKDSNDLTQESLIKMLSLEGGGSVKENIMSTNLCPVSISYEYDPNDYLKVREFLLKRRDPDFKKSKRDDLFSMETGILRFKGKVNFHVGNCINKDLESFKSENRLEIIRKTCSLIDSEIHCGYAIYPCNYISYDKINGTDQFKHLYTTDDVSNFETYVNGQLEKVDVPDITDEEKQYMYNLMLTMYANPLKNKLQSRCTL